MRAIVQATEEALSSFFAHEVSFHLEVITPLSTDSSTAAAAKFSNNDQPPEAKPVYYL